MTVYLCGSAEESFSVSEREFTNIVDFAFKQLRLPNTLDILFEFEDIGYDGFTHNYECENHQYVVVVSPGLEWEELVKTIFHEMAHVKQFLDKRLSGFVWEGIVYDPTQYDDLQQLPWEREAEALEESLYLEFISP